MLVFTLQIEIMYIYIHISLCHSISSLVFG